MAKKTGVFIIGSLVAVIIWAVLIVIVLTPTRPPETRTVAHLVSIEAWIDQFVEEHHRLPTTLLELPGVTGDLIKDGWDNEIRYSYTPDGHVTLSSPGPDRIMGEKGDIIYTYRFKVMVAPTPVSQPDPAKDGVR